MDDLFNIEPTAPRWRELADINGITTIFHDLNSPLASWEAEIEMFGSFERSWGDTEREATVRLIHSLKLYGWETVSI